MIKQAVIKSLSAKGSRIFPRRVILFLLRAKKPSKKSVREAREKQRAAKKLAVLPEKNYRMNKTGIKAILLRVKMFGKFNMLINR